MSSIEMMAEQSLEEQGQARRGTKEGRYYAELIYDLARISVNCGHDLDKELREIHAEYMRP